MNTNFKAAAMAAILGFCTMQASAVQTLPTQPQPPKTPGTCQLIQSTVCSPGGLLEQIGKLIGTK